MSFRVLKRLVTEEQKAIVKSRCIHKPKEACSGIIKTCSGMDDYAILPIGLWKHFYNEFPNKKPNNIDIHFKGKLLNSEKRDQVTVANEAIKQLNENRRVLLGCFTGMGKTCMTTYLTAYYKFKTVVICTISALHKQWKEEFEKFTNAKVSIIRGKKFDENADIYIVGPKKVLNMDMNLFKDIGLVVVDECHLLCSRVFSSSLQRFFPQYIIGLSATPDKSNGLDSIMHVYYSELENIIFRHEVKPFEIIKLCTNFFPDIIYTNYKGTTGINWTHLQNSLAFNKKRQLMIVDLAIKYKDKGVLILTKREKEASDISEILSSKNIKNDVLVGKKKNYDKCAPILIGGMKKIGVGFDCKMNVLILASDVMDIRQYEGRIRAHNNTIIDIVDKFGALEKHWKIREKWYIKRGATITVDNSRLKKKVKNEDDYDDPDISILN